MISDYKNIFTSGGNPSSTYVSRTGLEEELTENVGTNKLITITGQTKAGKTVLVRRFFPKEEAIWINGGAIRNEEDFWSSLFSGLDISDAETVVTQEKDSYGTNYDGQMDFGAKFFATLKMKGSKGLKKQTSSTTSLQNSRSLPHKLAAIKSLNSSDKKPIIIIDDFHYLEEKIKKSIIHTFKDLIFDGLNLILIAIPNREYDAVMIEKEMGARVVSIKVPQWSIDDLAQIPILGFEKLNKYISNHLIKKMALESMGSPHLMQDFCLKLCSYSDKQSNNNSTEIQIDDEKLNEIFKKVANTIGRPIFTQLAQGPNKHGSRKERKLKSGETVDIYGLVAHALSILQPGMERLHFNVINKTVQDQILEDPPQLFEITRVLKAMSQIAVSDSASSPVLDMVSEERCIYIMDPYFAYYLKWGDCSLSRNM